MSDLAETWVAEARKDTRRFVRWQGIAALFLGALHLLVIHPYADAARTLEVFESELANAAEDERTLTQIFDAALGIDRRLELLLGEAVAHLTVQFDRLNAAIRSLFEYAEAGGNAGGDGGEEAFGNGWLTWPVRSPLDTYFQDTQLGPDGADIPRPTSPSGAVLLRVVAVANDENALRSALSRWVDQHLIGPAFTVINRRIEEETGVIRAQAESLSRLLDRAVAGEAVERIPIARLREEITALADEDLSLRLRVPAGAEWWRTEGTKLTALRQEQWDQTLADAELAAYLEAARGLLDEASDHQKEAAELLANLRERFEDAQSVAGDFAGAWMGVFRLDDIARWLPLLLSGAFAVLIVSQAASSRELRRASRHLPEANSGTISLIESEVGRQMATNWPRFGALTTWVAIASFTASRTLSGEPLVLVAEFAIAVAILLGATITLHRAVQPGAHSDTTTAVAGS